MQQVSVVIPGVFELVNGASDSDFASEVQAFIENTFRVGTSAGVTR